MEAKNILEADGIVLNFGLQKVLSNVYIKCEQGQIVGVLGRNGSGKSSLFKVMFGTLEAESKSVRINSEYIGAMAKSSEINFLPQDSFMPHNITVQKALSLYGIPKSIILEDYPDLENTFLKKPDQLSGGELRLIEMLLIIYSNSKFCLLDEPFSGLSPVTIERVKQTLRKITERKGVLITDHLYRHVTALADRMYIIINGRTREMVQFDDLIKYGYLHNV